MEQKYDIVIFDCDSTLSTIEGIEYLAMQAGVEKEVAELTTKAMNGEVPFEDVFAKRLDIIQPKPEHLDWVGQEYIKNITAGAKELVEKLLKSNIEVHIVSGGYKKPVNILADFLGINKDNVHAVELIFDENGVYQNFNNENPLARAGGKADVVKTILPVDSKSIFIGDGATDLEVKGIVDLMIGFGGVVERSLIKENADIYISRLEDFRY